MRLILDRIEKNTQGTKIAVFEMRDTFLKVSEDNMPQGFINELEVGDIIEAEVCENKILSAEILKNETENKRNEMKSRLNSLFNRKKK